LAGAGGGRGVTGWGGGWAHRGPWRAAVEGGGALLVVSGDGGAWWRNVHRPTTAVEVLWQGAWRPARAEPLVPGHPDREEAWSTYAMRWPRARLPRSGVVLRVRAGDGNAT